MKIPRMTVVTLGVSDLKRSADFYEAIFATPPNRSYDGVVFIPLPGTWVSLYPLDKLAEDIGPEVPATRAPFNGVTLAYNARSKEEVLAVFERVQAAGARIAKPPQDTFWGGFGGYFADPDGNYWEVVWGAMFDFTEDGALLFKA